MLVLKPMVLMLHQEGNFQIKPTMMGTWYFWGAPKTGRFHGFGPWGEMGQVDPKLEDSLMTGL